VIVGWILVEAVRRFIDPPDVIGQTMLVVAGAGLLVNIVAFIVLHGGDQQNLNMRGAALHVVGDLLGSVAAVVAAIVILSTGWMPIDPILSVVVAMLILRSAWKLVRRSAHILLEGTPEWLDIADMQAKIISTVPDVSGIHHVHVWCQTPQNLMLTMHVVLDESVADVTAVVRNVKQILQAEFGINHSTIEVETGDCADH
jgi:cobalt-zinc-cadmium efflux system protein